MLSVHDVEFPVAKTDHQRVQQAVIPLPDQAIYFLFIHGTLIACYADGEEVIAGGSDAADCTRKLLALEQRYGEAVSIADVSDDCYERGRYIGKETQAKLQAIRKLLDEYKFIVTIKERMESYIFAAVRDFGGYDDPEKMALVIPYVQKSYVRLKLFEAYWKMTAPAQDVGSDGNGDQGT